MDKQMAPTSQMFSHGGILIRDWFSDRLQQKHSSWVTNTNRKLWEPQSSLAQHRDPRQETAQDTVWMLKPQTGLEVSLAKQWPSASGLFLKVSSTLFLPDLVYSSQYNPKILSMGGKGKCGHSSLRENPQVYQSPKCTHFCWSSQKDWQRVKNFCIFLMLALDSICI